MRRASVGFGFDQIVHEQRQRRRVAPRRSRFSAGRFAAIVSQAPGLAGTPRGDAQAVRAFAYASCTHSSARSRSRVTRSRTSAEHHHRAHLDAAERRRDPLGHDDATEKIIVPELSRLASLPKQDQEIVGRLFDYHLRSLQADIEQSERKKALFDREMWILHRGYELLDSEGEGGWPDTREEAITILGRHGERPPSLP